MTERYAAEDIQAVQVYDGVGAIKELDLTPAQRDAVAIALGNPDDVTNHRNELAEARAEIEIMESQLEESRSREDDLKERLRNLGECIDGGDI